MGIGDNYLTDVKVTSVAQDMAVYLDWNDEEIQIFTSDTSNAGDVELRLPTPRTSNTYGECWIVNDMKTAGPQVVVKDTHGTDTKLSYNIDKTDHTIPKQHSAVCKYVPQRNTDDVYGNPNPRSGWIVVVSEA